MSLQDDQRRLHEFNLAIAQLAEQAELQIPRLNQIIQRLAVTGAINDICFLGDIICQLPYAASSGRTDSAQVLQAALVSPGGGLGIAVFDSEQLCEFNPEPTAHEIRVCFVPFDQLLSVERGLLLVHAGTLVDRLCAMVLPSTGSRTAARINARRAEVNFDDMT